jgi:hypothetical protein
MDMKEKANGLFAKLPFRALAEKISAEARTKVPVLDKAIPFANQIVCALVLVIAVTLIACGGSGGGGGGGAKLTEKDFKYDMTKDGSGVKLLAYIGDKGGKLVIPDTIEGQPVVALGDIDVAENRGYCSGFSENSTETMKKLQENGFDAKIVGTSGNQNRKDRITAVTIPNTVTYIGEDSFFGCEDLKQVGWPKNLKVIGANAFHETALTSVTIPEGVIVGTNAFWECKSLTTVTLGENVEIRGSFKDCPELMTVNLPSKISYTVWNGNKWLVQKEAAFLSDAFRDCPKLSLAARKAIKESGYVGEF